MSVDRLSWAAAVHLPASSTPLVCWLSLKHRVCKQTKFPLLTNKICWRKALLINYAAVFAVGPAMLASSGNARALLPNSLAGKLLHVRRACEDAVEVQGQRDGREQLRF